MSDSSAWSGARHHINQSELMCRTGCGFYGNPAWDGHCSKCHRELTQRSQHHRKAVFDPTQKIRSKVSRSVSDVSELTSTATSLMSQKFDRFEEKRRQQLDKRTKAVKSIFRKPQVKSTGRTDQPKATRQLSFESQSAGQEFNDFLKSLSKEVQAGVSKQINGFVEKMLRCVEFQAVDESGEQVHDFYLAMSDWLGRQQGLTQEQVDTINSLTERYVATRLYKSLITTVNAVSEEKDLAIQKRIRSLSWVSSQHLDCGVRESEPQVRETLDIIITELIEMNSQRVPSDKLGCLVRASHQVMRLLQESHGTEEAAPTSADDFLPALIFCVLQANPPLLHSNLAFLTHFAQPQALQCGEAGYYFTNLCCAVAFIEKLTAESLGLTEDEFERYMSGMALPPNALNGDVWICEGMSVMQQNLKSLDDLQARMEALINNSGRLMAEMDTLQEEVTQEVAGVLQRTPLTLHPRQVNIDEDVPRDPLLPPPLTPQTTEGQTLVDEGSQEAGAEAGQGAAPLSPDILAAQQSLSFLQQLPDLTPGLVEEQHHAQENRSLLDDSPPSAMSGLPDLLDSFRVPAATGSGPAAGSGAPVVDRRALANPPSARPHAVSPYSGFTVQGGRIPNIPCDTGNTHSCPSPSHSSDPLSPSLDGPQPSLPAPLLPTAPTPDHSGGTQQPQKEDAIDKVYNVLGELVQTFDNLL